MVIWTDLSEVLIGGAYGLQKFVNQAYGYEVAKQFCHRSREMNSLFCDLMRGRFSEDEYWRIFLQGDWPFDADTAKSFMSHNMTCLVPNTMDVYQNIVYYPQWISHEEETPRIYDKPEIWLVSDHIRERIPELEYLHPEIFTLTSRQFWSFEAGCLKNDPRRFQEILDETGLWPDEVVFIDDNAKNTAVAESLGIASIAFSNAAQLRRRLNHLGFGFAD